MSESEYFSQVVRNLGKFGPVSNETVVIIIQVFQISLSEITSELAPCRACQSKTLLSPGAQQGSLPETVDQLAERGSSHREHFTCLQS